MPSLIEEERITLPCVVLLLDWSWLWEAVLANASMAIALSAHTPRVQLSVYNAGASWRSELAWDTPSNPLEHL